MTLSLPERSRPAQPAPPDVLRTGPAPAPRSLALLLLGGALVGLAAAFTLLVEKIRLLEDPTYEPSCSINPVLSCGSVMQTAQAEVFGFPNPIMGVIGFSVVATVGAALLAGASLPRWFWLGLQAGLVFGIVLVHWLVFQSLYRIGALCPYCMVVWTVTIPLFLFTTIHIARAGHLGARAGRLAGGLAGFGTTVLTAWYLVILALITVEFWTYWQTLLP